ncbi:HNH/ENDO VII family nuclease [Butyrivibrio sp. AD3002]|uniref:HNH/ENDO VII family nuclease n=1 Tax=Butyrivibrio sp. AD3002 TaxID=1280670 RepID=UPI0003B78BF7|nr:HNH/ENDO VII family nuclease [Butyrivibrio sp. AD3002]
MKKLMAIFLSLALLTASCASPTDANSFTDSSLEVKESEQEENSTQIESGSNTVDINYSSSISSDSDSVEKKDNLDIKVKGLDDEKLLTYVEDNIYLNLVEQLGSEDYFVENVEAIYYPKEYIEALSSNSQANVYFGYTAAELDDAFKGTKYVFTLGEDGQTVVVPMETVSDDIYVKAMEDVLIGSGVILVCVTVSMVSAPALPAVSVIMAASASTGTTFALSSGGLAFVAAAITKGYETESFDQAMKAGIVASGDGFKWGAITGAVLGGGGKAIALKGATVNGLTMNEVAKIQRESKYPLEVIKQFKSYKEYEVYKKAGLYTKMVNGKLALVRDIDLEFVSELPNGEKVTNLVRMKKGYAPIDPATGKAYQLHHINQNPNGTLAILTESEHQGNSAILNLFGKESEIDRAAFDKIRKEFWMKYAANLL